MAIFVAAITVSVTGPVWAKVPELLTGWNLPPDTSPNIELELYPKYGDDQSDQVDLFFRSEVVSKAASGKDIVVTLTTPRGLEPCFPSAFAAIQHPDRSWKPIEEQLECDRDKIVLTIPGDSESNGLAIGNYVLIFADNTVTEPQTKSFTMAAKVEEAGSLKGQYTTTVAGSEAYKKNGQVIGVVNRGQGTNQKVVPGRDWLMQTVTAGAGAQGHGRVNFTVWLNDLTIASAPGGKPAVFTYKAPAKTEFDCEQLSIEFPETPHRSLGINDVPDSSCEKTYLRIPLGGKPFAGYDSPLNVVISGVADSIDAQAWDFSAHAFLLDPAKGYTEFTTFTDIPKTKPSANSTTMAQASPTSGPSSLSARPRGSGGGAAVVLVYIVLGAAGVAGAAWWWLSRRKSQMPVSRR